MRRKKGGVDELKKLRSASGAILTDFVFAGLSRESKNK
jgi:hypothetical protein